MSATHSWNRSSALPETVYTTSSTTNLELPRSVHHESDGVYNMYTLHRIITTTITFRRTYCPTCITFTVFFLYPTSVVIEPTPLVTDCHPLAWSDGVMENAGLENDGLKNRAGNCRTGKCRTTHRRKSTC